MCMCVSMYPISQFVEAFGRTVCPKHLRGSDCKCRKRPSGELIRICPCIRLHGSPVHESEDHRDMSLRILRSFAQKMMKVYGLRLMPWLLQLGVMKHVSLSMDVIFTMVQCQVWDGRIAGVFLDDGIPYVSFSLAVEENEDNEDINLLFSNEFNEKLGEHLITAMLPPKCKLDRNAFYGVVQYLGRISYGNTRRSFQIFHERQDRNYQMQLRFGNQT